MPQRTHLLLGLLLTLLLGLGAPAVVGAQGTAWECAPAAAATPGVAASPAAAAGDVAFPAAGGELTVFAAASLTDAFTEIGTTLETEYPGLTLTFNFAGSQALVTQLTEGAEAEVFASANTAQMTAAQEAGVIAGEPVPFVANRLVVVVPSDNPAALEAPADLARDGLRLVLAQAEVPVGTYSRQAICLIGADAATYGDDFVGRVAANVVSEEEDVRDVLAKVQLGEADAGIVYASDAFIAGDEVQVIEIPDPVNVLASYPVAPVTGGDAELATAFIAHVLSADGQATLSEFGFEPIP
jgi:molybdate transport system substrate-binding protein